MNDKPTTATITIRSNYAADEVGLMIALSDLINPVSKSERPIVKSSGMRWQLDNSNDWWADLNGCELTITTRYEPYKLEALACYIRFFLG